MINIFDAKTNDYIGCTEYRPMALKSIIQYNGVNYDLVGISEAYITVTKRGGFGQFATPDYVLGDAAPKITGKHV